MEEIIKNRRSVRDYKPDPVSDNDISEIIKAAQFAPTAINNRAVEFIVVREAATKSKLYDIATPKQDFLKKAPVVLVLISDTKKSVLPEMDLAIASENVFLEAAALGLGTVWKNVKPEIAKSVMKLLKIPDNYVLVNLIPLGYAREEVPPHDDTMFDEKKIHYENYLLPENL